jgi:hypothetical protein
MQQADNVTEASDLVMKSASKEDDLSPHVLLKVVSDTLGL